MTEFKTHTHAMTARLIVAVVFAFCPFFLAIAF